MNINEGAPMSHGSGYNLYRLFNNNHQSGAILPLVTIGMLTLLAMGGLALDISHGYLNKSRLQNALDAAALSGAKTLDETKDTAMATTAAQTAFTMNANAAGNAELQTIVLGNVLIEFSDTLNLFVAGGATPRFVRVGVAAANFARPSWLLQTIGVANVPVGASAVAGPSSDLNCPQILPVAPCGTGGAANNYGYTVGQQVQLKYDSNNKGPIGNGNFGNVDLDALPGGGGNDIRQNMAGAYKGCTSLGDTIPTKTGNNVGPNAQGLNTRFNCPQPGCGGVDTSSYKSDVVIDAGSSGYPDTYSQYMTDRASADWDIQLPTAQLDPPRRLVAVPVVDCSTAVKGSGNLPVLGIACMFLTQPSTHSGNTQTIYAEFLSTGCIGQGSTPGPNPVIGTGPHTIILYKDFGVADS